MKFPTIVLAAGAAVLLVAVGIGQRMGDRVMQQATGERLQSVIPAAVSPSPGATAQPYGPDWKRSQSLSAAADPHFPDPRVPPQPLPTPLPTPKPVPVASAPLTPTPNPNIPIWRQKPLPTARPVPAQSDEGGEAASPEVQGSPGASPPP